MNGWIDLLFLIPKFVIQLIAHESPVINGDGTVSRDFTYIDNVIQMNHIASLNTKTEAIGQVFNTAVGERNDLNLIVKYLKEYLSAFDPEIANINIIYGPQRKCNIPHSHTSIAKAQKILGYNPSHNLQQGLKETVEWYWGNMKLK